MNREKIIWVVVIILILLFLIGIKNNRSNISTPTPELSYTSGNYTFNFEHDGLNRTYLVHAPESYDKNKKTAVVLATHGGGGNAADSPRFFQLEEMANEENFIIVYPQGHGKVNPLNRKIIGAWNSGIPEKGLQTDDVGYFSEVIDQVSENFNVDPKRIHLTGHSQGAQISHRLACELSDRIASIAVGGSHGIKFPPCELDRPISIFHFHGLVDPCSPYEGGTCGCLEVFPNDGWSCKSLPDYMDGWKEANQCSDKNEIVYQNGGATCTSYNQCADGVEVETCLIEDMGHTWPGNDYGVKICNNPDSLLCKQAAKLVGPLNDDLPGNEMIWDFFERHPMD